MNYAMILKKIKKNYENVNQIVNLNIKLLTGEDIENILFSPLGKYLDESFNNKKQEFSDTDTVKGAMHLYDVLEEIKMKLYNLTFLNNLNLIEPFENILYHDVFHVTDDKDKTVVKLYLELKNIKELEKYISI